MLMRWILVILLFGCKSNDIFQLPEPSPKLGEYFYITPPKENKRGLSFAGLEIDKSKTDEVGKFIQKHYRRFEYLLFHKTDSFWRPLLRDMQDELAKGGAYGWIHVFQSSINRFFAKRSWNFHMHSQ